MAELRETEERRFVRKYVRENDRTYRVVRFLLKPVANFLCHPSYEGQENIPESGSVILAANHRHAADPAFLSLATKRTVHYLAKKELHESPFGFFYRLAQTIPVDRQHKDAKSYAAAKAALDLERVIGIFPEGTRNPHPEELLPFKYGAVSLAAMTGAAIVPMAICGEIKPFSKNIHIVIGEAYHIAKDADLNIENEKLREVIAQLYERGTV